MKNLLAVDVGFGYIKGMGNNGERVLIPSVIAPAVEKGYDSRLYEQCKEKSLTISIGEDGTYFVGEMALRQGQLTLSTLNNEKIESEELNILFSAALVLLAENYCYEADVVTGLPVTDYKRYKGKLKDRFEGTHDIRLLGRDIEERFLVTVKNVSIMPQPFGTIFNEFFDEEGEVINEEIGGGKIGILDVGFKTTDFVLADELDFISYLSSSSDVGLSQAYRDLSRGLNEIGIGKKPYELHNVFKDKRIKCRGEVLDISELVDGALENISKAIASELYSLWRDGINELDMIIVTGGGGEVLWPYLQAVLPRTARLSPGAQFANCEGYLKFARYSGK